MRLAATVSTDREAEEFSQFLDVPRSEKRTGDPSMQIHATRIAIFVIHNILQRARQSSSRWLIKSYNFVTFVRNPQSESGMSPPDYSPGMPSAGASPPC